MVCPRRGSFFIFLKTNEGTVLPRRHRNQVAAAVPSYKPGKTLQHGLSWTVSRCLQPWVFPLKNKASNKQELALQGGSEH